MALEKIKIVFEQQANTTKLYAIEMLNLTKYIIAIFLDCYINPAFTVIHFFSKKLLNSFGLQ